MHGCAHSRKIINKKCSRGEKRNFILSHWFIWLLLRELTFLNACWSNGIWKRRIFCSSSYENCLSFIVNMNTEITVTLFIVTKYIYCNLKHEWIEVNHWVWLNFKKIHYLLADSFWGMAWPIESYFQLWFFVE